MKYTTLFFDLDRTLLDFDAAQYDAFFETFKEADLDTYYLYDEINERQWRRIERGEANREQVLRDRFVELFKIKGWDHYDPIKTGNEYLDRLQYGHKLIDTTIETLDALYGKYDLCVTTNGTPFVQRKRMIDSGIIKYFNKLFISAEIGAVKPSPEFFKIAYDNVKENDKSKILVIGDSVYSDVKGAHSIGLHACWMNLKGEENNEGITPEYEIRKPIEILDILK